MVKAKDKIKTPRQTQYLPRAGYPYKPAHRPNTNRSDPAKQISGGLSMRPARWSITNLLTN